MPEITSTNIRVGPGVYLALKEMADKTGLTIGTCANLLVVIMLYNADQSLSTFRSETQKALTADILAAFSEIFKMASLETIRNTSIADLYQNLLSQPKEKYPKGKVRKCGKTRILLRQALPNRKNCGTS